MIVFNRDPQNPILKPNPQNDWEASAAFNGSIAKNNETYHLLYRAVGKEAEHESHKLRLSTIGYAKSNDGVNFTQRKQLIKPEYEWEKYGCEDPRVTKIGDMYYIFYTALSDYPHTPLGIKLAVALTRDFVTIEEKHLVTPFNAKAMALFPEKINGKYVAVLTANTDFPPARIALAAFDNISDMWSHEYWQSWLHELENNRIPLMRFNRDQVEAGAAPIKTERGWLFLYSHISNYNTSSVSFGVEAALLDLNDPHTVIARTSESLINAEADYEKHGDVPNIVFPSGALVEGELLYLYYGGADSVCARASTPLAPLLSHMFSYETKPHIALKLTKFEHNPILYPEPNHYWESQSVFNAAAFAAEDKIHIVYRAMSADNTSSMGYASTRDGVHIDERFIEPIYLPRMDFEDKKKPGGNSGCEDPRITKIGDTLYMCYTAYDGINVPRVAITSIPYEDFKNHRFVWKKPVLISPPNLDDKDACIFPEKVLGHYTIVHRIQNQIVIDRVNSLEFDGNSFLHGTGFIGPRGRGWDGLKIGLCAPPVKTADGWLLLYHGVSDIDHEYRVGAMILDLYEPSRVLYRTKYPILEPTTQFERVGIVNNVVFPCGMTLVEDTLYVYYGGADTTLCVAYIDIYNLIAYMKQNPVTP